MKRRSILSVAVLLLGVGFLPAQDPPVAAAESFGELDQEFYIGAAAFRPTADDHQYRTFSDGYLYRVAQQFDNDEYIAPLVLPAGAVIHQICLYGFRNQAAIGGLDLYLDVAKLVPAGVSPGALTIPGSAIHFTWEFGHGVVCTEPSFSYTYRETGDVDGDGNLEHLTHRFRMAIQEHDTGTNQRFGGVGVFWRRQVSPAPLVATFADVPVVHGFFPFVEALAASGITAGCGSGNFCPDSPLTRGQMAVFLAKSLGLHWPY